MAIIVGPTGEGLHSVQGILDGSSHSNMMMIHNTRLSQSNSMYQIHSSEGSTYSSRSKGMYRHDIPMTIIIAILEGGDLFLSSPIYSWAERGVTYFLCHCLMIVRDEPTN